MNEFEIIRRFFAGHDKSRRGVVLGIGDDAAVVEPEAGTQQVIATDMLCVGTHFPAALSPHALGYRCLAVNLSDLAAMGAEPRWFTLALSLETADEQWLEQFSAGLFTLADAAGVVLIGGDTVRGPLSTAVTVHGTVPSGRYLTRSGAGAGEDVYVTGTPGDAAAGLEMVGSAVNADGAQLVRRFCYPEPRLPVAIALRGIASAAIDISDGLHVDLSRLLAASGIGAELDIENLPVSAELLRHAGRNAAVRYALTGGDDYELCFTAPAEYAERVFAIANETGVACTRIGRTDVKSGASWCLDDAAFAVPDAGFTHFEG